MIFRHPADIRNGTSLWGMAVFKGGKGSTPKNPEGPEPSEFRISQFTPQGNLIFGNTDAQGNFVYDPKAADAASQIQEAPFQQRLRLQQEDIAGQLAGQAQTQAGQLPTGSLSTQGLSAQNVDTSGLPGIPTDFSGLRQRAEDASFARSERLLNPVFERQENRLRQDLANRGQPIAQGTAGGSEFDIFNQQRNLSYEDAANQAVLAGGAESDRLLNQALGTRGQLFGENLSTAQQAGAEQNRVFGLQQAARQQQFNELAALLGGQQVGTTAQANFQLPNPADAANAGFQADLAAYNARVGNSQANTQGLFGLGSALGAAGIQRYCWVAREVYGPENVRWVLFREWLFAHAPRWLILAYGRHGPRWAAWLRDKPRAKRVVRWFMDKAIARLD